MIWIILGFGTWLFFIIKEIIALYKGKRTSLREHYDWERHSFYKRENVTMVKCVDWQPLQATFIVGFIGFLSFSLIGNLISSTFINTTPTVTSVYNLYNLSDVNVSGGRLILGSGTIENEPVFSYYTDGKNGGYVLAWKPASQSSVYTDSKPRMEVVSYVYDKTIWFVGTEKETKHYNFYVPAGSVKPVYNLDAQ